MCPRHPCVRGDACPESGAGITPGLGGSSRDGRHRRSGALQGHAVSARRVRPAADASRRSPACLRSRKRSTWASPVEACSGRPTQARIGCRLPTARFRSDRWDRLPSPTRIPKSSTSAPAPTACAATCRPAVASTRRPTAATRGSSSGLYNAGQIGAVRIHPTNPNVVWVAAMGDAFKRNDERGIFKTEDGGKTWKNVLFVNDGVGAMDVELQPGNPAVVYAWMSRARAQAVDDHQWLERRRLLQEHERRQYVHEDHDRTADGTDRQGQPRRDGCKA